MGVLKPWNSDEPTEIGPIFKYEAIFFYKTKKEKKSMIYFYTSTDL